MGPAEIGIAAFIIFVGAAVAGIAGFGFSIIATVTLTILRGPQEAVALTLPALFVVNLSLVTGLDRDGLRSCTRRFFPFVLTVTAGGLVGLIALNTLPDAVTIPFLVAITAATVLSQQRLFAVPFLAATADRCFVEHNAAMAAVGLVSGIVFGATNIGLLVVAYLKSCSLEQSVFAGVVGLSLIGTTALRYIVGVGIGLYPSSTLLLLSIGAVPVAAAGTALGRRLQDRLSSQTGRRFVILLLTVIGIRLSLTLL